MEKIRSEALSQGTSLLTFYTPFKRSDKMYQKIKKMIEDLELHGRSNNAIKSRVYIIDNFSIFYNKNCYCTHNTILFCNTFDE